MKHYKRFKRAFGVNEYGMIAFPKKLSNVRISRIQNYVKMGGCRYCFPHGVECTNSKYSKQTRNWKSYRRFQYKMISLSENLVIQILEYKSFIGTIEYCNVDKVFHGQILYISDLVTYEAMHVVELKSAFVEAIEDYGLFKQMLESNRSNTVSFKKVRVELEKISTQKREVIK